MKNLKLGTKLNLGFFAALFVPMILATAYSIIYFGNKIQEEALNKVSSDLKIASLIYKTKVSDAENLARSYAKDKSLVALFSLRLNERLGRDLAKTMTLNGLDMITVIDRNRNVITRAHQPTRYGDRYLINSNLEEQVLKGKTVAGTELLPLSALQLEEIPIEQPQGGKSNQVLVLTGAAPVYSRGKKDLVGIIIVRKIISNHSEIIREISKKTNADSAIYENHTLLVTNVNSNEASWAQIIATKPHIVREVLKGNDYKYANIERGGFLAKYEPIQNLSKVPIGMLMVRISAKTYVKTRINAFTTFAVIFIGGLIFSLGIKFILAKQIVVPIHKLKEGTHLIAEGNYSQEIKIANKDELGSLARSFNRMAKELNDSYTKLEDYSRNLEEKVEQRTSELVEANRQMAKANSLLEETMERLNPGVSRLIAEGKQKLGLIEATELITDLCGYTRMNMILGERLMGGIMTQFFRETHILLAQYHGFRDKTIGDQIVATFGIVKDNLHPSPFHAFDGIFCGLAMQETVGDINEILKELIHDNYSEISSRLLSMPVEDRKDLDINQLTLQIRVGINTSNPSTGKEIDQLRMVMMGAETVEDYTGQGGALIYAARLEGNGTPGDIHIGENTKRIVEHIFEVEELPAIRLKGLGVQSRYKVIKPRNIFVNISPKSNLYKKYFQNLPDELLSALETVKVGKVMIPEVRKIQEYFDATIPYLEHRVGVYKLAYSRALFSYALAKEVEIPHESCIAVLYACIWFNQSNTDSQGIQIEERYTLEEQLPHYVQEEKLQEIINQLMTRNINSIEAKIIDIASKFDEYCYDRTYLLERKHEVRSPKEAISILYESLLYPESLVSSLESLMIVKEGIEKSKIQHKSLLLQEDKLNNVIRLIKQKKYMDAIELLDSEEEANKSSAEYFYYLGFCQQHLGQLDAAEKNYESATNLKKNYFYALHQLGITLTKQKKWDEAEKVFKDAVRIEPKSAVAYYNYAAMLIQAGKQDEVQPILFKLENLDPDKVKVLEVFLD
ncbi:MAG: class 3 adenylate cyclase/HAMP domain-containing protein [bacterium]|jgi:class 3 adenylate cyclase/HAMP domain-containing protein